MSRFLLLMVGAAATITATAGFASPAEARSHGHVRSVQGRYGHGYVQQRHVTRSPGHRELTRSLQTNSGRGYDSRRYADWGDGHYSGGRTTNLNDGTSFGRATSATRYDDGSVGWSRTRSYRDGSTATRSGTWDPNRD